MHVDADGKSRVSRLAALYRTHGDLVRWVVRTRGIPPASVEDVVHDVFLALHRRWGERAPGVPVRAWIIAVARNVVFSERRSQARRERRNRGVKDVFEPCGLDLQVDARRALGVLQRFVDELPPGQAEVFVLSEVHGVPSSEVASGLGCSVNTVYSRLRLARARFAAQFGEIPPCDYATLLQEIERAAKPPRHEADRRWALLVPQLLTTTASRTASATLSSLGGWVGCIAGMALVASVVGSLRAATMLPSQGGASRSIPSPPSGLRTGSLVASAPLARADGDERRAAVAFRDRSAGRSAVPRSRSTEPTRSARADGSAQHEATPVAASPADTHLSTDARAATNANTHVGTEARAAANANTDLSTEARAASNANTDLGTEARAASNANTDLGAEARALRLAKAQLNDGRIEDSLRALQDHARTFPAGALELERLRLTIDAWCRAGRRDRAAKVAADLEARSSDRFPGRSQEQPCDKGGE